MMEIRILAFGVARDIIGSHSISMQVKEVMTAAELKMQLGNSYDQLKKLKSFMIAVNDEYADPGTLIHPGDEVAIIPPVSGG